MTKYEIMLLVSAETEESAADNTINELIKSLNVNDIKLTKHGVKEMAYEIKKQKRAYYYQLNFESDNAEGLNEFRRLARINKSILRQLAINLEKDYGFKATVNPKKIERSQKRSEVYVKHQEEAKARSEERAAYYENLLKKRQEQENN